MNKALKKALKKVLKLKSNKKSTQYFAKKKVNLLKEGLKKVHPVKKLNSRKCIHSKKSELKKSSKN